VAARWGFGIRSQVVNHGEKEVLLVTKILARGAMSALLLALMAGCATAPSSGPGPLRAPPGVTLPLPARVAVQVNPTMPGTQTVEFRGETWQYADAELMQQAATNVFRQVFAEVGTPERVGAPTVTFQLNGSSSVNPVMSEYYANATATIFQGRNTYVQPIASLSGSGQASQPNFTRGGIAQAYEGAFRQIANQLLADPNLVARLR